MKRAEHVLVCEEATRAGRLAGVKPRGSSSAAPMLETVAGRIVSGVEERKQVVCDYFAKLYREEKVEAWPEWMDFDPTEMDGWDKISWWDGTRVREVANRLAKGKTAGKDGVSAEMLQALAAGPQGLPPVRMMLANDELRVVLVTIHLALRKAIDAVTFDAVLETLRIAHRTSALWGQLAPRIAVAGLNPHAGEGGLFGDEELRVIGPAIQAARAEGVDASGPYAPDTVFMRARHAPGHPGEFALVVAMTHDHGLIPVKYLGVEQGVNVTLGLPFVRTSPDHGTAFDIAGTGRADPASLRAALRAAWQLSGSGF